MSFTLALQDISGWSDTSSAKGRSNKWQGIFTANAGRALDDHVIPRLLGCPLSFEVVHAISPFYCPIDPKVYLLRKCVETVI